MIKNTKLYKSIEVAVYDKDNPENKYIMCIRWPIDSNTPLTDNDFFYDFDQGIRPLTTFSWSEPGGPKPEFYYVSPGKYKLSYHLYDIDEEKFEDKEIILISDDPKAP